MDACFYSPEVVKHMSMLTLPPTADTRTLRKHMILYHHGKRLR